MEEEIKNKINWLRQDHVDTLIHILKLGESIKNSAKDQLVRYFLNNPEDLYIIL